eukprot:c4694_g1_i1.p1 GENE.c4694_g1_i1~~c4694_g1_i1.p1  ORF type:complete len:149 (+),score=25.39 c4694_g1_i1:1325-1771(+)
MSTRSWPENTQLHFAFVDGTRKQKQFMRENFATWNQHNHSVRFSEVDDPMTSEIRVGFDFTQPTFVYIGRDCVNEDIVSRGEKTMNISLPITDENAVQVALRQIGHASGLDPSVWTFDMTSIPNKPVHSSLAHTEIVSEGAMMTLVNY